MIRCDAYASQLWYDQPKFSFAYFLSHVDNKAIFFFKESVTVVLSINAACLPIPCFIGHSDNSAFFFGVSIAFSRSLLTAKFGCMPGYVLTRSRWLSLLSDESTQVYRRSRQWSPRYRSDFQRNVS